MYNNKYGVSLRPNCFKSSPRSPAPQLSAQIFNCPAYSAVRWCSCHNLGILGRGPLGPFCGWGTLAGPCGCRSWARVPAASYAPVGPFSRPVVARPAGAVCPCWRVARVTPGVHESMDMVRCIGGQPIAATLLVASKISLRLLRWPPTEHQCVLIYSCVFTHVCCWLFSVGKKVTTTTNMPTDPSYDVNGLLGRVLTDEIKISMQKMYFWATWYLCCDIKP